MKTTKYAFVLAIAVAFFSALKVHASYDPSTGRWFSRDPIEEQGGQNIYRFADNSAVNFVDPMGQRPIDFAFDAFIDGKRGDWIYEPFSLFTQFGTDGRDFGQFDKNTGNARLFSYGTIESTKIGKAENGGAWGNTKTGVSHRRQRIFGLSFFGQTGFLWGAPQAQQAEVQNPNPKIVDVGPCETIIIFSPSAGYPFTPSLLTPNIDYTAIFDFKVIGKDKVLVSLTGAHNLFPDYEAYSDGSLMYHLPSLNLGPGLWDLSLRTSINTSGKVIKAETDCCGQK